MNKAQEPKPPRVDFHQLLREKRDLLVKTQKDFTNQVNVRKINLDNALNAALGVRRNAISEVRKAAEWQQTAHKVQYDNLKASALKEYDDESVRIAKERDHAIEAAKYAKEAAYSHIRDELEKAEAPHIEKHKADIKALTEKHEKDEADAKAEVEKAVKEIQEDIKDLEEEITERRKRAQQAAGTPS